ncbi:hypothetical protein PR048_017648 [Dryococelus australis]|uniref:Ribosomal RNA-processing protein 42 n=1 Tax=Dryococelus australis TaxID=614101 RepID=A0ABQ9HA43_9NEOP|nr:hypothetical protein PR048_017648 [Dryococelus australis]
MQPPTAWKPRSSTTPVDREDSNSFAKLADVYNYPTSFQNDLRCDGRSRMQYRPIELETDVVPHASGSACLRLANTHVLVGVKTEIDVPFPEFPNEGKLEFFIDCTRAGRLGSKPRGCLGIIHVVGSKWDSELTCAVLGNAGAFPNIEEMLLLMYCAHSSANATPAFEGRGGEELAVEISNSLARSYQSPQSFNLTALNIMPGQQCWKLYVDILILECGGNLFDAISLAVKAALFNTHIPQVKAASVDGGTVELNLSDDPFDCWRLDVSHTPVLMTLCKVGEHCILDPTGEEETCCAASAVVAVNPDARVTSVFKTGVGSFNPQTLVESLKVRQLTC